MIVVTGDEPIPEGPAAILAVDSAAPWRADHAARAAEVAAAPERAARDAWHARLLYRPAVTDAPADWLEAVSAACGGSAELVRAGPGARLDVADGAAFARLDEGEWVRVVAPEPAALLSTLRGIADARGRAAAVARREGDAQRTARLLAILAHDLRNVFFPIQLGAKLLERQHGAVRSVQAIGRSANDGVELVRKLVAGAWVFGGSPPAPRPAASARLPDVWGRVLEWAAERYPERPYRADPPPGVIVGVDSLTLETLLTTTFGNALHHGDAPPVEVTWSEAADHVRVTVRNRGALPFPDFRALEPLDHRARGALGIGLYAARRLAEVHGVGIDVRAVGDEVEATLTLPR